MNFSRGTLENACDGYTKKSPRMGLNMADIKLYLHQENIQVPKGVNRSNLQEILCTHLKTLSKTVVYNNSSNGVVLGQNNYDKLEMGDDERDIKIQGLNGMNNIEKVLYILERSIRNEDFDKPIQWRRETLQRYSGQKDFERRMKDKDEPGYKDNIEKLKKDIGDLERLRVLRKILVSGN
jgi:hypothetical protein